jgi:hypothetical protein
VIYVLWAYAIGAAATALMLAWRLIFHTEKVLGLVRTKVGPSLEALRETLGDGGLRIVVALVMVLTLIYQTLLWPWTMWHAIKTENQR